jgi:predicted XRE-type DNA-binding protein
MKTDALEIESFECVWDAICSSPQEANEMCARSDLFSAIERIVLSEGSRPAEFARRHQVSVKTVRQILTHRFNELSLKDLLDLAASLGFRPVIRLQKRQGI